MDQIRQQKKLFIAQLADPSALGDEMGRRATSVLF